MGIEIHWNLEYTGEDPSIPLLSVREWAVRSRLFRYVGQVRLFVGRDCDYANYTKDQRDFWLMIQAACDNHVPLAMYGLKLWWGDGCEETNLFLAKYSPSQKNWQSRSSTKTHYASDFVTAHMATCAALESLSKQPGMTVTVYDDAGFWEKRSVSELVRELDEWNEYIQRVSELLCKRYHCSKA
jgi:hypothetical protein